MMTLDVTTQRVEASARAAQYALVGVIGLMLLLLIGAVWFHTRSDLDDAFESARSRQVSLAGLISEQLGRTMSEADTVLAALVWEHAQSGDLERVRKLAAAAFSSNSPFEFVSVVDRKGKLRFSTRPVEASLDVSSSENFRFHAGNAAQRLFISRPRMGLASKKLTVYLSRRLHDPDDTFAGIVTLAIDPTYFTRLVKAMELEKGTLVSVIGVDGIVRLGCEHAASRVGLDVGATDYFARMIRMGSGGPFRGIHPVDNVARTQAFRMLEHYPLLVLVGQPEAELTARVDEHNRPSYLKSGAASLFIVLLGIVAVRQVGRTAEARSRAHALAVKLEAIMDAQPNCVKVMNGEGTILYMNSRGKEVLGCRDAESVIGKSTRDFVLPEHWDTVRQGVAQVLAGDSAMATFQIQTLAGETRWIESRMSPLPSEHGELQVVSACIDITERKRAEDRLRRSENRLREAQRVAQVGDWHLDLRTSELTWSDETYRILEIDTESLTPSCDAFLGRVHPDDRARVVKTYRNAVESRRSYRIRHRLLLERGRVKHVEQRAVTEYADDGTAVRSMGTVQDVTAFERVQAAIQAERQFTNAIFEHAAALVIVLDTKGSVRRTNRAMQSMLGGPPLPASDGHPRQWMSAFRMECERDRSAIHEVLAAALGTVIQYQNQVKNAQGEVRVIDWTMTSCLVEDGAARNVVAVGVDVTRRVANERHLRSTNEELEHCVFERTEELRAERNLIASILDVLGAIVIVMDLQGRLEQVNREMRVITGYDTTDLIGMSWSSLLVALDQDPMSRLVTALQDAQRTVREDFDLVTRNGAVRTIAWTFTKVGSPNGGEHVIGSGIDITVQRHAELALQASEQLFRELAENIREVFFVRDVASGTLIYVSPTFETIWGQSVATVLGESSVFGRMIHPVDRKRIAAAVGRCAQTGCYECAMEYRILDARGATRWLYERSFPVKDVGGQVVRVAGFVEDISERKREEAERIARLEAQREVLVREVHHRIKNNLQGVAGLLQQHGTVHPQIRGVIDAAIGQVRSMAIIHGLQAKDPSERIELAEMVSAIMAAVQSMYEKPFELSADANCARYVVRLESETVPLALILNELMTNAAKHSCTLRCPIKVGIDATVHGVKVTIENRKADTTTRVVNWDERLGLGTGLDLVRALVPRHGLKVSVDDTGESFSACVLVEGSLLESLETRGVDTGDADGSQTIG